MKKVPNTPIFQDIYSHLAVLSEGINWSLIMLLGFISVWKRLTH